MTQRPYSTFATLWESTLEPILQAADPKIIVEIGSDHGHMTTHLLTFCEERGGALHVIDPDPKYDPHEWQCRHGSTFSFHRDTSLNVLPNIQAYDAVFIDGDHNWYTVYHELLLIEERAETQGTFPLVLLHDIHWPYGRRDLYYDPERIPEEHRKPYERRGLLPGVPGLAACGGFNATLHHACEEGGDRNGVLAAVEDYLARTEYGLRWFSLPGIHGVGIIASSTLLREKPALAGLLDGWQLNLVASNHLLEVERQRIDALISVLDRERTVNALKETLDALRQECVRLRTEQGQRAEETAQLQQQVGEQHRLVHELHQSLASVSQDRNDLNGTLQRMVQTRSWQYTAALRLAEERLRRLL